MLLHWLARHRIIAALLALAYLVLVTLTHDMMQRPAHWAQDQLGGRVWNIVVLSVALPLLASMSVWLAIRLVSHPRRWIAGTYVTLTLVLAAVSFFRLLQVNIEIIHFPQYAILGLLIFGATGRYADAMILGTVGGIIDEGWQYWYLHGHWNTYFDFNDVILNAIGVGMALTAVFVLYPRFARPKAHWPFLTGVIVVVGIAIVLANVGVISATKVDAGREWVIALRRCSPASQFWNTTDWGKTYHIVEPWLGLATAGALVLLYSTLDLVHTDRSRPEDSAV